MTDPRKWMPLYIGDYLKDTARLTTEQHGAYLLLIMDYWTAGPLPDDDEQLGAVAKLDPKGWRKMRPTMARFFQIDTGHWRHKRIDAEMERAATNTEKRSKAGSAGAASRWQTHGNAITEPIAEASQNDGPSPSPSPVSKETSKKYLAEFPRFWQEFPKRVAKAAAVKAYGKARNEGATEQQILDGIERYRRMKPDYADWCHPATWLNQQRWLDEAPSTATGNVIQYAEPWPQRLSAWRGGMKWNNEQWGPEPSEPGCRVPPELLKDAA